MRDNLFEGSAWAGLSLDKVTTGTISGNTFRNMAKSAVFLSFSADITLDNNTYEGNNRAAWRVVRTANWMNDGTFGLSGRGSSKSGTMESEALQTLLRMTKAQAVAAGMDGDLYDAATANTVYRDPGLHAAVWIAGSPRVTISNSSFSNNHNSIAICGEVICRVDGLEAVGADGDNGRALAYISPLTYPVVDGGNPRVASSVTLSGNQFTDSDTRSFDGPGTIGNHLVIGYHRASKSNSNRGPAVGSIIVGVGNSFMGSGVFGGDARLPKTHQITRGDTDAKLKTSLDAVFSSGFDPTTGGSTLAAVKAGDIIEFGPGLYEDIGRWISFWLQLDKANLTVRGARDPRLGQASGECDPTRDTILTGSSGFALRAAGITVEHFCFQNIDDGSTTHSTPHNLTTINTEHTADGATIRRNRIDNTIGLGVSGPQ